MGSGAASMRRLARQLEAIPDEAVRELVAWFVPRSEEVGGRARWMGRTIKLTSRIKTRKAGQASTSVVVGGTPAGIWAIKSYGRRGNYDIVPRHKEALRFKGVEFAERVTIERGTTGDDRWPRLVIEASDKFPDVVAELVARRVVRI